LESLLISKQEYEQARNSVIHVSSVELFGVIPYGYHQGMFADKINITGCNLLCKNCITPQYCYESRHDIVKPVKSIFQAVFRTQAVAPVTVVLSGGEPTSIGHFQLVALCDSLYNYETIIVQTNGTNPFDKLHCKQPEKIWNCVTIRASSSYTINKGLTNIDEINILVTEQLPKDLLYDITTAYPDLPKFLIPDESNYEMCYMHAVEAKRKNKYPAKKCMEWAIRPMLRRK